MLSYRHAFHAGGHADVLKHLVLLEILRGLTVKAAALRYVETHAGAGAYDLGGHEAQKNREHADGIGKLWSRPQPPPPVAALLDLVRRYNGARGALGRYPGSPSLARERLRPQDRLYLFELHPTVHAALARSVEGDRRVTVLRQDGLAGCVGLVPPPERRGLVFMDPSYELADEWARVVDALVKAHRRFATGVYAIWYPLIERRLVRGFERELRGSGLPRIELFELSVRPDAPGRGMTGSGVVVVNPPWKLRDRLGPALPWLADTLGIGGGGAHRMLTLAEDRR